MMMMMMIIVTIIILIILQVRHKRKLDALLPILPAKKVHLKTLCMKQKDDSER
jgi:hypothetical protein